VLSRGASLKGSILRYATRLGKIIPGSHAYLGSKEYALTREPVDSSAVPLEFASRAPNNPGSPHSQQDVFFIGDRIISENLLSQKELFRKVRNTVRSHKNIFSDGTIQRF